MGGTGFRSVASGVAWRNILTTFRSPALYLPPVMFPLTLFAAFAGGLSSLGQAPGFHFRSGYTSFEFVFILLLGTVFNGVFVGLSMANDFECGLARRLLLAAPKRTGIIAGYAAAALVRGAFVAGAAFAAGLIAGMRIDGNAGEVAGLLAIALLFGEAGTLWAGVVAVKFRSVQAAPLMQVPVFLSLFLGPVFVPFALLNGWIHGAAAANPVRVLLEAGRGYISGQPTNTLTAFGILALLLASLTAWSVRSLQGADLAR